MPQLIRWGLPLLFLAFFATSSFADVAPAIICTETDDAGCTGTIPTTTALIVASDGEGSFDPFKAGFDTSDGIVLNANWVANNSNGAFNTGFWQELGSTSVWVLPAETPCGVENEPSCEPIGSWYNPGATWGPDTPSMAFILDPGGGISDTIFLNNNGPEGSAQILFASDSAVPEPTTVGVCLAGLLTIAAVRRGQRNRARQ